MNFTIPGDPVPWERNDSRHGVRYTAPRTREYQAHVRDIAHANGVTPLEGPVRLTVRFFRGTARTCDLDNLSKSVQDALNGVAWHDDSQVTYLIATKLIDLELPRAEVEIEPDVSAQTGADLRAVLGPKPREKLNRRRLKSSVRRYGER